MASFTEYVCLSYQRGKCQYGRQCIHRHDEQGVKPAERHVKMSMKAKYGEKALETEDPWQEAEPLEYVKNSKGTPYPLIPDPSKESRIGLAQAVKSMQKSTVIKAMRISYIQNHAASTKQYFEEFHPSHDPQEYGEHILLNFILQCQQQHADDEEVVKHIIEKGSRKESAILKKEFSLTTELRVDVRNKAQQDLSDA